MTSSQYLNVSLFAAVFAISACTTAVSAKGDSLAIMTAKQIGLIELGMSEAELVAAVDGYEYSRETHFDGETETHNVSYIVQFGQDATVIANLYDLGAVEGISTSSHEFSTLEGVGVGASAGELLAVYPSGRLITAYNHGIMRFFVVDDGRHGVFMFGKGRCEDEHHSNVTDDCNAVLPEEITTEYWTNDAYTEPGRWAN